MVQSKKASGLTSDAEKLIEIRLPLKAIRAIDRWAERNNVTRSEAIRRLLKSSLAASRAAAKLKVISG